MKFLLISAGCAECHSPQFGPLIEATLYDTFEEAKQGSWLREREWVEHPQGGQCATSGQGDDWIIEIPENFVLKKE